MFRYKRTILSEHNTPGLKPTASDMPLLTWSQNLHKGWNHINSGLSLAVGFKPGTLRSPRMARLYRNVFNTHM
jgi:hypothetical protein